MIEQFQRVVETERIRAGQADNRGEIVAADAVLILKRGARAIIQLRLPCTVLISPLWARKRNGCAIAQVGSVLVLYRWWNNAIALV